MSRYNCRASLKSKNVLSLCEAILTPQSEMVVVGEQEQDAARGNVPPSMCGAKAIQTSAWNSLVLGRQSRIFFEALLPHCSRDSQGGYSSIQSLFLAGSLEFICHKRVISQGERRLATMGFSDAEFEDPFRTRVVSEGRF